MTASTVAGRRLAPASGLFAATVFGGAALVFLVQPMVAKLVLPLLGGSPSVWNASVAFFQTALLAGYGYAHLLQRLVSLRVQAAVHVTALVAAALVLPLQIHQPFGPPTSDHPALWLLGVLAASIGAPFAILSATAPLVQAWHARVFGGGEGRSEPYVLYAASNLGSLLALLAYPAVVEPFVSLSIQRVGWSLGYGLFLLLVAGLALVVARSAGPAVKRASVGARPAWRDRLVWLALAAIPSSLMLGVTTHITTDVASTPLLWVAPLALYLLTFVIAFAGRPIVPRPVTLALQAAAAAASATLIPSSSTPLLGQFVAHLAAFFFTALMCHQALVARRPSPHQLTDFYLWISIGGVVGGAFNAFVAPVIFDNVWEYPLVLVLAALARPWSSRRVTVRAWATLAMVTAAAMGAMVLTTFRSRFPEAAVVGDANLSHLLMVTLLAAAAIGAVRLRDDAVLFCAALAALSIGAHGATERAPATQSWRSFFGVLRLSESPSHALGGPVRMMAHGTTLHGAQAVNPAFSCRPLVYYTPLTPIGQVIESLQAEQPSLRIGAVGLGTGSVAAYVRAADRLTFFEIDPLVVRVAGDPRYFSYMSRCAKGPVDVVVGDARLTLARQPAGTFDILLIDAFSSDTVPSHLLTVEALRGYLGQLKPDGVMILHLSNRHLELLRPAQAAALAAGGAALVQQHRMFGGGAWEADEDAVIVARTPQALARFARDRRWRAADPAGVRPWTDDYVNVPGALWRKLDQNLRGFY